MSTTVVINDKAQEAILNKKVYMKEKYDINMTMSALASAAIVGGIDKVEEELGLNKDRKG